MMVIKILLFLLVGLSQHSFAQKRISPETGKQGQYHKLALPSFSPDGQWLAVRKRQEGVPDSLFFYSTSKRKETFKTKYSQYAFLGTSEVLLFSPNVTHCDCHNLKRNETVSFIDVKRVIPLSGRESFALLHQNGSLKIFSGCRSIPIQTDSITGIFTDKMNELYASQEYNGRTKLFSYETGLKQQIFEEEGIISSTTFGENNNFIFSLREDKKEMYKIFRYSPAHDSLKWTSSLNFPGSAIMNIMSGNHNKDMLIRTEETYSEDPSSVQVIHSQDPNIKAVQNGKKVIRRHWLLRDGDDPLLLPNHYSHYLLVGSQNLLAYKPSELQDYIHYSPSITIHFRQQASQKFVGIGTASSPVLVSADGNMLMFQNDKKTWHLVILSDGEVNQQIIYFPVDIVAQNPMFTIKGDAILFESNSGIWRYNVSSKKLSSLLNTVGRKATFVLAERQLLEPALRIYQSTIDENNLLIALEDSQSRTEYLKLSYKKALQLIPPIKHLVHQMTTDTQHHHTAWIEEYYNLPTRLMYRSPTGKTFLLAENNTDKAATQIRREIVTYKVGSEMAQGTLFYPTDYKHGLKYPMVVRIYQHQQDMARQYMLPGDRKATGFNLRSLLSNGYFVYLPDIVPLSEGPGISSLKSVEAALDVLNHIAGIDLKRIGLTGHSYGGYETNFIATHSKRFAAYVSGAGIADIVKDYFSYNYHYQTPSFWQYETGQFAFKTDPSNSPELFYNNNPIIHTIGVTHPFLLWTGKLDAVVSWDHTINFLMALKRYSKMAIALIYPQSGHTLNVRDAHDLEAKIMDWWEYWLKEKKDASWIHETS